MSHESGAHRPGSGDWLEWESQPVVPDEDAAARDQGPEDGPWLRHDLTDASPVEEADSPWLAPEVTIAPGRAEPADVEDTGVPPTLADPAVSPTPDHRAAPAEAGYAVTPAPEASSPAVASRPPEASPPPVEPLRPAAASQALPVERSEDAESTGSRRRRSRRQEPDEPTGGLAVVRAAVKEFVIVVGMALVLSFIVKTWLLQAFYIPSGSMEDTLRINDRVIVSKLTPGPIDLKRGDIIVFGDPGDWVEPVVQEKHGTVVTVLRDTLTFVGLLPDDSENHLIKRVIGLPGDRVACCDPSGHVTVNGKAVDEPYLKPGVSPSESDFDITVPRGRVWVMGDNRPGSGDSRAHDFPDNDGRTGSVDERLIVGRAVALVWPLDHFRWLGNPSDTFADVPAPPPTDVEEQSPEGEDPGSEPDGGSGEGTTGGGDVGSEGGG